MPSIETLLASIRQQYADEQAGAVRSARTQVSAHLNQFLRRVRQYQSEQEFTRAVVDGASMFAERAAFFAVEGASLCLRTEKGMADLQRDLRFDVASGRAFTEAIEAREIVVALRTASEVGAQLAGSDRAIVVPIHNAERVAAVLFASGDADAEGLDLIAAVASLVLSRKGTQKGLAELAAATPEFPPASGLKAHPAPSTLKAKFPPWAALSEEQRNLHWRAQRFARVKVSEWLLAKPEAARAGLEQNDVYLFLKKEIDAAREAFRNQFTGDRSMVDYLHVELISAAADGDESKLGTDYPGPLV